jgi:hypothetical protein
LLSLKLHLGSDINGDDILTLAGPKVTAFGKKHLDEIATYIDIVLQAERNTRERSFLEDWAETSPKRPYFVFDGKSSRGLPERHITYYDFQWNISVLEFCEALIRDAENILREDTGFPRVGEGWVAETELYHKIREAFPAHDVQHHASPKWLGRQHLDIFIPKLKVAIEYQGRQHDEPVEYFGGEEAFKKTKRRDARKRRLCEEKGVRLLHVRPGYSLEEVIEQVRE